MQSPPPKTLYRMAARIHEQMQNVRRPIVPPIPQFEWERLLNTVLRMAIVETRGWRASRQALNRDFAQDAGVVIRRLEHCRQEIGSTSRPERRATVSDLYDDLIDLHNEFGDLEVNLRQRLLSVATDEIVLEGVPLGRFEIVLSVKELGRNQPYEIVARDGGHPASGNSDVVHPHVQDGSLCEGEGRAPIRAALQEGRLYDFFVLVRQILQTYNRGSAYVPLEQWHGKECRDCGGMTPVDDATYCGRCDHDLCGDCSSGCTSCGRTLCSDCRTQCTGCDEDVCDPCAVPCSCCASTFCPSCLTDGRCDSCTQPEDTPDETTGSEAKNADAANDSPSLHPVCLGEAAVPA